MTENTAFDTAVWVLDEDTYSEVDPVTYEEIREMRWKNFACTVEIDGREGRGLQSGTTLSFDVASIGTDGKITLIHRVRSRIIEESYEQVPFLDVNDYYVAYDTGTLQAVFDEFKVYFSRPVTINNAP